MSRGPIYPGTVSEQLPYGPAIFRRFNKHSRPLDAVASYESAVPRISNLGRVHSAGLYREFALPHRRVVPSLQVRHLYQSMRIGRYDVQWLFQIYQVCCWQADCLVCKVQQAELVSRIWWPCLLQGVQLMDGRRAGCRWKSCATLQRVSCDEAHQSAQYGSL